MVKKGKKADKGVTHKNNSSIVAPTIANRSKAIK
jgi:hypothetical protein